MWWFVAIEECVIGMALLDDSPVQLDHVEPLRGELDELIVHGLVEEGIISAAAEVAFPQDDQWAWIRAPDLFQRALEVETLLSRRKNVVPAQGEALLGKSAALEAHGCAARASAGSTACTTAAAATN